MVSPVPLLFGPDNAPAIAFDIAYGVRGLTSASDKALQALHEVCSEPDICHEVRIGVGDLLVIDNRKCAHASSLFGAKFDGTDRWLQHVYVVIASGSFKTLAWIIHSGYWPRFGLFRIT